MRAVCMASQHDLAGLLDKTLQVINECETCGTDVRYLWVLSFTSNNAGIFFFLVCFTSFFVFHIADLPHSPGVVSYHLLMRRETRIPGVAPFSSEILYTHSLWEGVDHSRSKMHYTSLIIIHAPGMRPGPESNRGPLD